MLGSGSGVGRVTAVDVAVDIDCLIVAGAQDSGSCGDKFFDAGAGGLFVLFAEPNPGSVFVGWSDCDSTDGNECELNFGAGEGTVSFSPRVTFDLDPANVCNATFGTSAGYVLCEETPTSCTFYTLLNDINSCGTLCASFSSTCNRALRDTDDTCVPGEVGSCDDVVGDRLCDCTKP